MKLDAGRVTGGVWEALVTAAEAPVIEAVHGGRVIEGVEVHAVAGQPGRFALRMPIPAWVLNEGLQTILVRSGEATVATVTLVAGEPLDEDIQAELTLLRAELDLLKRAFQRHVREG